MFNVSFVAKCADANCITCGSGAGNGCTACKTAYFLVDATKTCTGKSNES